MSQFFNNPVKVLKESFINRTSYVPNAGMILKNIKLTDEGYIACRVQYSNGHIHKHIVRLVVTGKHEKYTVLNGDIMKNLVLESTKI